MPVSSGLCAFLSIRDWRVAERTYKPNSVLIEMSGDHSSGRHIAMSLERPTRERAPDLTTRRLKRTAFNCVLLFGLAPQGVCLAEHVATLAGDAFTSPFHHRPRAKHATSNVLLVFEIPCCARWGCLFSVALFRRVSPPGR